MERCPACLRETSTPRWWPNVRREPRGRDWCWTPGKSYTSGSQDRSSRTCMSCSPWTPPQRDWRTGHPPHLPCSTGKRVFFFIVYTPVNILHPQKCLNFILDVEITILNTCILIKCFSPIYRCVLNWFGDWSNGALYQVGREFTNKIDLEKGNYMAPQNIPVMYNLPVNPSHREVVINAFVFVHLSLHQANSRVLKRGGRITSVTPRHYLDFINHFVSL